MPLFCLVAPTPRHTPRLGTHEPGDEVEAVPEFDGDIRTFPNPVFWVEADAGPAARPAPVPKAAPVAELPSTTSEEDKN